MSTPPPAEPPPDALPPGGAATTPDQRNWAMAAHLSALIAFLGVPSLVGPLVVWAIKRNEDPFIADHAREALNFNLSALLYVLVLGVGGVVAVVLTFGLAVLLIVPLVIAVVIVWLVLVVQGGIRAANGQAHRYPFTLRLVS